MQALLYQLFARQRRLSSQRALDNWELLGLRARMRPRQEVLRAACASLEARRTALSASGASEGEGGAAHLAAQRECRRLEARLGRAALLAARHQRRLGYVAEVHRLRSGVLESLLSRHLSAILSALLRLTDEANVAPNATPRLAAAAPPPRAREQAAAGQGTLPALPAASAASCPPPECDLSAVALPLYGVPAHRAAARPVPPGQARPSSAPRHPQPHRPRAKPLVHAEALELGEPELSPRTLRQRAPPHGI